MRLIPFVVVLAFLSTPLSAQLQMRGWEAGAWVGTAFYLGDLNTDFRFNRPGPALGFAGRYNFNHRLAAGMSLNYARIEADDADSENAFERTRNLQFTSNIIDFTAQVEFNFLPYYHGSPEYWFSPYAFVGVSTFNHSPRARLDADNTVALRNIRTENVTYSELATALTYGIGIRWDITYAWSFDVRLAVRNTGTDYLDDVSDRYPDLSQLDPLARRLSDRSLPPAEGGPRPDLSGSQRGDKTNNDRYLTLGIGVNYYFGDVHCPTIEKGRRKRQRKRNTPKRKKSKR